jgi:hypothetical protein
MPQSKVAPADSRALLNLDKCSDPGLVADLATVEIHKPVHLYVPAQLDRGRNELKSVHD